MTSRLEIERKFLVTGSLDFLTMHPKTRIVQGYPLVTENVEMRVRATGESQHSLTIKIGGVALTRDESEWAVDAEVFDEVMTVSDTRTICKDRYSLPPGDVASFWEVDVFDGPNAGLVIAEIELTPDFDPITIPEWCSTEVTGDGRFYNAYLASRPITDWDQEDLTYLKIVPRGQQ